jgi:LmbE family N-acetylglucosaminyl deacetylase
MRSKNNIWVSALVIASLISATANAQVQPVYDLGTNALARQLQRIQTTASVLHTGAHPDDEDSALVAYHARGEHARTAYLSLTRGSGGQNIIGAEQSDLLGVIRTEELLQARRLDGAEQLFTRANDFGFSKHRAEGSRMWDEAAVLEDVVRAIRQFRPTVVVSRWDGTPADGHGHHQFAGYLTPQAIAAAADPLSFPHQLAEGYSTWQVQKFYVAQRVDANTSGAHLLVVNTGEYDAISGRSYFEIGMQGRSQQKTQQMGSLELRGRQLSGMQLIDANVDTPQVEKSAFDGLDTTISGIASFEPDPSPELVKMLADLEEAASSALSRFSPLDTPALIPYLVDGLEIARTAYDQSRGLDSRRLLGEKIKEFESAIVLAAGVSVDALASKEMPVPGSELQVAVRIYGPEAADSRSTDVRLISPPGWTLSRTEEEILSNERRYRRRDRPDSQFSFNVKVPVDAEFTQPYWLRNSRDAFTYDWSEAGGAKNLPFEPPLLSAEVTLAIGGTSVTVEREVQYRYVDRIRGEIRRRLDVVPAISVDPAADLVVIPATAETREFDVLLTLRNNTDDEVAGTARFALPDSWTLQPASTEFMLAAYPASTTLAFKATMPDMIAAGEYKLQGIATIDDAVFNQSMREIAYPHIRTHRVYSASTTEFKVIDVEVAPVRVGYVTGSGDKVPEALQRLGLDVTILDDAGLTTGDLSRFDTIIVGIRASQTRPAFVANNSRLIEFAEQGGTLIVQYQQPDFIEKGLAPFPASMEGNVRVVDETAKVTIIEPDHPVFTFPNRIRPGDFDGWIQERNNYNFTSFDRDRYIPLTESHDEGEPDSDGGMLYAKIGKGHYVYTSYSWFRQLPNGTPGAYRLFANLLSLPTAPK